MNKKAFVKEFIVETARWINYEYENNIGNNFEMIQRGYNAYILRDKAIPKRIIKYLKNKFNITATCEQRIFYGDDNIEYAVVLKNIKRIE